MEFREGMVVFSKAGHDAGSYYMVVQCGSKCCWIADGRRRRVEAPKRKNHLHLAATSHRIDRAEVTSNRKLRQLLAHWNNQTPTE